jgi:ABC-2 type transport system ATP-binding protein
MINFINVSKTYKTDFWAKKFFALEGVSFSVNTKSLTGFLGANGAGKTTSLKILMDFVRQDSGSVQFDKSLGSNKKDIFSRIGYLPERPYFYQSLTGYEFLNYMGKLQGLDNKFLKEQIVKWSKTFNINYALDRKVKGYSKGMLQRLGMASTLLHDPQLVILDEPLSGLDPVGRKEIKDVLLELNKSGHTIFFSSHIVSDIEEICDDVVVLEKGKCIYSGKVNDLIVASGDFVWEVSYRNAIGVSKESVTVEDKDNRIKQLIMDGSTILSVNLKRQSLESIIYKINER